MSLKEAIFINLDVGRISTVGGWMSEWVFSDPKTEGSHFMQLKVSCTYN